MTLSIVILNYNVRYFLELCLRSVQAALSDLDAEIIVVDNHSSDGSVDMVKHLFPEIILIENKQNFGFSKGNNIGVAKAQGDYVCILNPDTVVAEDTFKTLLGYADSKLNIGIVGCQLIDGRGKFLPESKRNIPTPLVAVKKILGLGKGYYAQHLSESEIGVVDILVGAFMLIKKSIYQEVKGFDEDYFMYGEDIDLSYKVIKAGYQNAYYGATAIIHYKGESTLKDKTYAKRFYGAMQIFYQKHFKSHAVFDLLVRLGVEMSQWMPKPTAETVKKLNAYALITTNPDFTTKLPFNFYKINNLSKVEQPKQIVFDARTLDYKTIIWHMMSSKKDQELQFRILSEDHHYLLGSDTSQQRGEVVLVGITE